MFAWQQDEGGDGPLNAIAAAAERTQREPGGRVALRAIASPPTSSESLTISAHGVYDEGGRSRMVFTVPRPDSDDPTEMEAVIDGAAMYVSSDMFGNLPGGSKWMKMDFSFAKELNMPLPANADPKGELALLEAATGEVRKLGKEEVRGVPTTRYRGTVDAAEEDAKPLLVEAWIDADGLVRRMRLVKSQSREQSDGSTPIDMWVDFFDFGISPEIDVPEEDEVFDATALLRAQLDRTSD